MSVAWVLVRQFQLPARSLETRARFGRERLQLRGSVGLLRLKVALAEAEIEEAEVEKEMARCRSSKCSSVSKRSVLEAANVPVSPGGFPGGKSDAACSAAASEREDSRERIRVNVERLQESVQGLGVLASPIPQHVSPVGNSNVQPQVFDMTLDDLLGETTPEYECGSAACAAVEGFEEVPFWPVDPPNPERCLAARDVNVHVQNNVFTNVAVQNVEAQV